MSNQTAVVQRLRDRNRQLVEESKQWKAEKRRLQSEARRREAEKRRLQSEARRREAEKSKLAEQLRSERALWSSEATDRRLTHGDARLMHRLEVLDDILGREDSLHAFTGMSKERFGTLTAEFGEEIARLRGTPLFKDDPRHRKRAGNRCRLHMRHALLLSLAQKRAHAPQEVLAGVFGIDQAAISRQLKLCDRVLEKILPTGKTIHAGIAECKTDRERREFIPGPGGGTIIIDGTRSQHVRPKDKKRKEGMYSGKIKRHSVNTLITSNGMGVVIGVSKTIPGKLGDLRMAPHLGKAFPSLLSKGTIKAYRIRALTDGGFLGFNKMFPGAEWIRPHRKPPKKELTKKKKAENKKISRERVVVEHAIGRLKNYAILRDPFRGTLGEYNRQINIVSGLVNRNLLYDDLQAGRGAFGKLMARRRKKRLKRSRRR